jgi:hypothetical protein
VRLDRAGIGPGPLPPEPGFFAQGSVQKSVLISPGIAPKGAGTLIVTIERPNTG